MQTYTPPKGSLAHDVCAILATQERVSEVGLASKYGRPAIWVAERLADAVSGGALARRRDGDGNICYYLPARFAAPPMAPAPTSPAATAAPAAPAPKRPGVPRGTRAAPLPPIDLAALKVTLQPRADGKTRNAKDTKWGPLFDRLAAMPPGNAEYPTVELPREYGKALQAAARVYCIKHGSRIKLRVSINAASAVLQRVA